MFTKHTLAALLPLLFSLIVIPIVLVYLFIPHLYFYDPYGYVLQAFGEKYLHYGYSIIDVPFQASLSAVINASQSGDPLLVGKLYGAFLFGLMLAITFLFIYFSTRSFLASLVTVMLVSSNPTISLFGIMPYKEAFGTLFYVLSLVFILINPRLKRRVLCIVGSMTFFAVAIVTRPEALAYIGGPYFMLIILSLISPKFERGIKIRYLLPATLMLNYLSLSLFYAGQIITFGSIFPYFSNPGYDQRLLNSLYDLHVYQTALKYLFDDVFLLPRFFASSYLVNFLLIAGLITSAIIIRRKSNIRSEMQDVFSLIAPISIIHGIALTYVSLPTPRVMVLSKTSIYLSFGMLLGWFIHRPNIRFKLPTNHTPARVLTVILMIIMVIIPNMSFSAESIDNASNLMGIYNDALETLMNFGLNDSVALVPMYEVFWLNAPTEVRGNLIGYVDMWNKAGVEYNIHATEKEKLTVAQFLRKELMNNTKIRYIIIDNVDDSINLLLPYLQDWINSNTVKLAVYSSLFRPWDWTVQVKVLKIIRR